MYETMAPVDVEEQLIEATDGGKTNTLLELREIEGERSTGWERKEVGTYLVSRCLD